MDKAAFQGRVKRLKEVNAIISKIDPSVRAAAFTLLEDYVRTESSSSTKTSKKTSTTATVGDRERFFSAYDNMRVSENALLVAAWWFSQYGTSSFSLAQIRAIADDVGITIPDRVDMTFRAAKRNKKSLFKRAGTGKYAATVHGQTYLKQTYNVKQGTKIPPSGE